MHAQYMVLGNLLQPQKEQQRKAEAWPDLCGTVSIRVTCILKAPGKVAAHNSPQRCAPETTEGSILAAETKVSFELLENWSQRAPWMCSFEVYFQQEENRTLLIAAFDPCQTISSDFLQTLLLLRLFLGSQGGICLVGERWVGWRAWPVLDRGIARQLHHASQLSILIWPMETLKPQIRKCQAMDGFLPSSGAWMSVPAKPAGWPWTSLFPLPAQSPLRTQRDSIPFLTARENKLSYRGNKIKNWLLIKSNGEQKVVDNIFKILNGKNCLLRPLCPAKKNLSK